MILPCLAWVLLRNFDFFLYKRDTVIHPVPEVQDCIFQDEWGAELRITCKSPFKDSPGSHCQRKTQRSWTWLYAWYPFRYRPWWSIFSYVISILDKVKLMLHHNHILISRIKAPFLFQDLSEESLAGVSPGYPDLRVIEYAQPVKPFHHAGVFTKSQVPDNLVFNRDIRSDKP